MTNLVKSLKIGNNSYVIKDPNTYPSLSASQRSTLLSAGTYLGNPVDSGSVFTSSSGKLEEYLAEVDPTTSSVTWDYVGTTTTGAANVCAVAYGAGKFVVVPSGDYSADGVNWTSGTLGTIFTDGCKAICYGDGKFVAISGSASVAKAAYSTDGIDWEEVTVPEGHAWTWVTYGDGVYIAVAQSDRVYAKSVDGANWTVSALSERATSVAYGDGVFVATDAYGQYIQYSTDGGMTWNAATRDSTVQTLYLGYVVYCNGRFVATGWDANWAPTNTYAYSTDGINWTAHELPALAAAAATSYVVAGDNLFLHVNSTTYSLSADGLTWSTRRDLSAGTSNAMDCGGYGNGIFVLGNNYNTSVVCSGPLTESVNRSLSSLSYTKDEIDNKGYLQNTATGTSSLTLLGTTTANGSAMNIGIESEVTQSHGTAIGRGAKVRGQYSVAIGNYAVNNAKRGVALGYTAVLSNTAHGAIQLGSGTNSTPGTLQVSLNNDGSSDSSVDYLLLDYSGKIPADRYIAMTGADGTNAGTIGAVPPPSASDNNKFLRGDGTWANAGGGGGSSAVDSGPNDPSSAYTADEGTRYFNTVTGQNFIYADVENFRRLFYGAPYLTIVNGVATGFNSNGYMQLAQKFNPGNNDWEILMHLKTPSTFVTSGLIGYSPNTYCGLKWEINSSGKMSLSLASVSNSWDIANGVTGSTTLSADTEYWYKIVHSQSGETYKGFISTDGTTYTEDISISSSSGLHNYGSALYIGRSGNNYFAGSIYLKDMKITISGDVWWTPYITTCRKILLNGTDDPTSVSIDTTANNFETLTSSDVPAKDVVNIGNGSRATAARSTVIGAMTSSTYSSGTAIGYSARAAANYAIQLGYGTNSVANTMNVGLSTNDNFQLLDSNGHIPPDRTATLPVADGTYIPVLTINNGTATITWTAYTPVQAVSSLPASPDANTLYAVTGS